MELSSKKLLLRTVLLPAVFCYASCPAQTLRGLVVDEQERSVTGVTVLVQGLGTEKTRSANSDSDGKFFFSNAPRPYKLIVQQKPARESVFTLYYSAQFNSPESTDTALTFIDNECKNSLSHNRNSSSLQNLSTALKYKELAAGGDFSFYRQRNNQTLADSDGSMTDGTMRTSPSIRHRRNRQCQGSSA